MKNEAKKKPGDNQIKSPEDLHAFAQSYYSSEFPNPDRKGCPGVELIESLVRSETLPDEGMRLHLFSCSDCFSAFREAIAIHKEALILQPISRRRFYFFDFKLKPLLAASLILLMIFGLIFYSLSRHSQPSTVTEFASERMPDPEEGDSDSPATLLADAGEVASDSDSPAGPKPRSSFKSSSRRGRQHIAAVEIRIDLREDVMREAEAGQSGDDKLIELPPRRTSLLIDLPDNSSKGIYEIKIVDPFGKQLITGNGLSRDGKTLKVPLDLRGLAEARYRICVSRFSEAPNCYQIRISGKALKR